jgi:hypothetical protein
MRARRRGLPESAAVMRPLMLPGFVSAEEGVCAADGRPLRMTRAKTAIEPRLIGNVRAACYTRGPPQSSARVGGGADAWKSPLKRTA